MRAVADASALISGPGFSGEDEIYITPLIEAEVASLPTLKALMETCLRIAIPSPGALIKVREGARETGDEARLSEADIEVLALALDKGLPIISDDYSIQNLALRLGVEFLALAEPGIKEEIKWRYRCRGCGKYFPGRQKNDTCPVCGSTVRTAR